ncbi:MAG: hypothetical protein Q4A60_05460 [Pasteurellaceae bacterium]|nr:hypothetical protein [Pasteurellaceae bacterium]
MAIPHFRDHYYLDDITKKSLSFLECFDELETVAIMLGFKPSFRTELFNNEYDWFVAPVKQLRKDVEYGRLTNSNYTTEQGYDFGIVDIYQVNSLDMKE